MEKKSQTELLSSQQSVAITFKVSMKVQNQPFIQLYELNSLDDAIKACLSIYANIPTTVMIVLEDSAGLTHLTMQRYA